MLVITHYKRILDYVQPEHVHIMMDGRVVESGGPDLVDQLEATGYKPFFDKYGLVPTED